MGRDFTCEPPSITVSHIHLGEVNGNPLQYSCWKILWTEGPSRLQSMGSQNLSDFTFFSFFKFFFLFYLFIFPFIFISWRLINWRLHFHFSLSFIGEGNDNPLQCSSLENPREGRAWWAAVFGVAQSRTRLKRLSRSSSSIYI